jgi:hypothetical protein
MAHRLSPEAEADLDDIWFYVARESGSLEIADRLIDSITQRFVMAFNATNTPYFGAPNGISFATPNSLVPDGPRMGEIRSLEAPMRTMQLGLKLFW